MCFNSLIYSTIFIFYYQLLISIIINNHTKYYDNNCSFLTIRNFYWWENVHSVLLNTWIFCGMFSNIEVCLKEKWWREQNYTIYYWTKITIYINSFSLQMIECDYINKRLNYDKNMGIVITFIKNRKKEGKVSFLKKKRNFTIQITQLTSAWLR